MSRSHRAGRSTRVLQALDAGDPVASQSSWYRIARQLEPQRPTRRRARHRSSAIPSLVADAPLQIWSWDITKLKGPYRGLSYELYMVLDVFSRMIAAWRLEEHEDDELAKEMSKPRSPGSAPDPRWSTPTVARR